MQVEHLFGSSLAEHVAQPVPQVAVQEPLAKKYPSRQAEHCGGAPLLVHVLQLAIPLSFPLPLAFSPHK